MSQEKVERYKQEKANRKTTLKKEKVKKAVYKTIGVICCVGVITWIGFSVYITYEKKVAEKPIVVELETMDDYMATLN